MRSARQDHTPLEAVQDTRCLTHAAIGVTRIERWGRQRFAWGQTIAEVEWIVTACDTHLVEGALLHGDTPASAPSQFAKVDAAVLFIAGGLRRFKRKPGIRLVPG